MKKRDIVTLIVLGIIFIFIFVIIMINNSNEEEKKEKTEFNNLSLLENESIFLTVSNSINKICEYSNNKLALNYILKENDNNDYSNMSFKAEEIYVVSNLELYKYYVEGSFYREIMDMVPEYIKKGYFILNYDMGSSSYNIEIIDKEKYKNAKNDKYVFEKINKNNYNNFEYSNLSPKSRALLYFNDYLTKIYYDTEKAYELLTDETIENYFSTYDDFEKFIENNENIRLKEFSINGNNIGIIDNYGNEYLFEISYVLKYKVTINKTEE